MEVKLLKHFLHLRKYIYQLCRPNTRDYFKKMNDLQAVFFYRHKKISPENHFKSPRKERERLSAYKLYRSFFFLKK